MNKYFQCVLIVSLIALFSLTCVSAHDNLTDTLSTDEPETPSISINSTTAHTGDSIEITLKDSNNESLANQNLTANIDDKDYLLFTDSQGKTNFKLDLKPNNYVLKLSFKGNGTISGINETFNITVLKSDPNLSPVTTTVVSGNYFYVYLTDQNGDAITDVNVKFKVNGKKYNGDTDSDGKAGFKVSLNPFTYSLSIVFGGNDYYNSVSKTIQLIVPQTTSIVIGNTKLLTNGYLRIYLKSPNQAVISKKTVKITINGNAFIKKTNNEGIIVFKPNMGTGNLNILVEFDGTSTIAGCSASKTVKGIDGNVKNPLKTKIPLKNGVPDIDYMPASYVMADGNMKYSLTKAQYRAVIKRDSYCLYLKNKLSKYTFFKSKAEPKLNHIIKREKWNVIERAINTKIVKKNKKGYWPNQITVSLKGKSYTYSEVRDIQNTGYTCGPTSSSMCSQVLRNYFNEKYLSQQSGTSSYYGSSTSGLKNGLEKNHFKCTLYSKSSFNKALKQLRKGGAALIFHTWSHYVAILDISKDGKKVLVGNPSGDYNHGSHKILTNWLTVKYMKKRFNNYDTVGLIVKLKYSLSKSTKKSLNNFYSSMGTKWARQNTNERIPNIGM